MKTLFLLHGFGVNSKIWDPASYELSNSFEILIPDLPGHGETYVNFHGIRASAEKLAHVIEEGEIAKLDLVGWSMGGQIAIELCEILPKRISSLTLVSTSPKFTSEGFEYGYNKAVFSKFHKGLKGNYSKVMEEFYRLMFSKIEDPEGHLEFLMGQMPSQETILSCMEALENEDQREKLSTISVPTLILSGSDDLICSPQASKFMAKQIKGAKLKVVKGAGHALFLTRKKEFTDAVRDFIK